MGRNRFLSILTGIAGGIMTACAYVLILRQASFAVLSAGTAILAVFVAALLNCTGFTENWNCDPFTVSVTMGLTSLCIGLLYAWIAAKNDTAFQQLAGLAVLPHAAALLLRTAQQLFQNRTKG